MFGQTNTTQSETSQMLGSKLAQSSSLNLSDSDIQPLENDPFTFTYFHYPQEVGQLGDGHYVQFDILENVKSKLVNPTTNRGELDLTIDTDDVDSAYGEIVDAFGSKVLEGLGNWFDDQIKGDDLQNIDYLKKTKANAQQAGKKISQMKNKPRDRFEDTHSQKASSSILLYTPAETKFEYKANYENAETGIAGGFLGDTGGNIADGMKGGEMLGRIAQQAIQGAAEMFAPGIGAVIDRKSGMAINPNLEMAFKSVPFRPFNFDFDFAPKNKKELEQVHKIIKLFKFHMLPALSPAEGFFISPSQFQIMYMYRQNENTYIPKLAKCVLTSMDVDYSPGEKFTTLKPMKDGASPQHMKMKLQFSEMSIITKETVAGGY
jgi:hypothetical protein